MSVAPTWVVLGLGNPVRGDDAVGLAVATALQRLLERDPLDGVVVRTSERGGLEILDAIVGASEAVLVDCVELGNAEPGRIRWLAADAVERGVRIGGAHDLDLPGVLRLGRLLDLPMPRTARVLAIESLPCQELEERLSPPVAASVERVAATLYAELAGGTVGRSGQRTADSRQQTAKGS